MIEFSSKTKVDKAFRMSELLTSIKADKTVRADAKGVRRVTLANIISNTTLNVHTEGEVKEIYVFEIEVEEDAVPQIFISALDKEIYFHTLFVLCSDGGRRLCAAYKHISDRSVKTGKYYIGERMDNCAIIKLPLAADTPDEIYAEIFAAILPIPRRRKESAEEYVTRFEGVRKLKAEAEKLQKAVNTERQAKQRFELNGKLKEIKKEIEEKTK